MAIDVKFNGISEWILGLNHVNLVNYGISKKALYRTKRSIKLGHVQKLSKNTKLKFINCHHKLAKMVTSKESVTSTSPVMPVIKESKRG